MVRDTSIEVYNKIKADGLLSKKRFELYDHIYHYGPLTASSAFKALGWKTNQSGRFTELEQRGVIRAIGKTEDADTGHTVTLWDITSHLPEQQMVHKRSDWKFMALGILEGVMKGETEVEALKAVKQIIEQKL